MALLKMTPSFQYGYLKNELNHLYMKSPLLQNFGRSEKINTKRGRNRLPPRDTAVYSALPHLCLEFKARTIPKLKTK